MPSINVRGSDWNVNLDPKLSLGGKPGGIVFTTKIRPPSAPGRGESGAEVITVTRVSYSLKPAPAAALLTLLKDNVKMAFLEIQSGGENSVVTTTPDAQKAIGQFIPVLQGPSAIRRDESGAEVITLTRVTYKLKAATAEALAKFLKENGKAAILVTGREGETLVVTTTQDAQHAIGQFIRFLQEPTAVPNPKKTIAPAGEHQGGAAIPRGTNPAPAPPTEVRSAKTAHPEISPTLGDWGWWKP
jgi:hypothetical protein